MNSYLNHINQLLAELLVNAPFLLKIMMVIWAVHFVNAILGYRLCFLGVYPRSPLGLPGIICSPWLHGSFGHIISNSLFLYILGMIVLLNGVDHFYQASVYIVLISGGLLWLVGRQALHVGASGVIMGYWSYILLSAIMHPGIITVVILVVSLAYMGSLFVNLVPTDKQSSWEGHLCGFVAGIATVWLVPWQVVS